MTEKIPVGFSTNDFFYNSVRSPFNATDACKTNDIDLKNDIRNYFNDLKFNYTSKQSKRNVDTNGNQINNYEFVDKGVPTILPNEVPGKEDLINKTVEYYRLVCENKRIVNELKDTISKNLDGDLKYNDAVTYYNREYLNRINLGIGIVFTIGFIFYCINAKPKAELPVPKLSLSK